MVDQTTTREMTFEEFTAKYVGKRYEYVNGRAVPMGPESEGQVAPTKSLHGRVVGRITVFVGGYVLEHGLGEIYGAESGFLMVDDPPQMRAADLAFYPREKLHQIDDDAWLPFAPDLAVEVVSPFDSATEVRAKANAYLKAGTRLLWIAYPDEAVLDIYELNKGVVTVSGDDMLDGGDVLPGFSIKVSRLFEVLDD